MAEMSTLYERQSRHFSIQEEKESSRFKPQKLEYKSWDGPKPRPYGRAISIQKAKAANKFYGRTEFPPFSGGSSGQFPGENRIISFAKTMASTFYHRQEPQAMAA